MTWYKTFRRRLDACGWELIDEGRGGNLIPFYFKFSHPASTELIEFTADSNKDGTPGRILQLWKGDRPCRV